MFKLKNTITGKFLTAPGSVDGDVTHEAAGANQDWYFISIFIHIYCTLFLRTKVNVMGIIALECDYL